MEESNIRWGELVGGLLIIGCSVALVVSFWTPISQRPWLEFSVFTAVTAAFFGLGLYTEHRWKLPSTSRAILLIATLLVPLNFLAFAAFSAGHWPGILTLAAEAVAFLIFASLVWQAGKVIAPVWPRLLTIGAATLSAILVLLGCVTVGNFTAWRFYFLACLPLGAYGIFTGFMLAHARRWRTIHATGAYAIFLLLGVLTFSTALSLGLLIHRSGDPEAALQHLALPLSLSGLPFLATGMLLWRRVPGKTLATLRTIGTSLAVVGALILVAGIAIAWPDPIAMLPVALCDFVALTSIALFFEVPAAHWLALPCGIVAWVMGYHLFRGLIHRESTSGDVVNALLSGNSGPALVPLVLLLGGTWESLSRLRRKVDAAIYAGIAVAIASLSIALISWTSFGRSPDLYGATWVYAIYAIVAFAIAWRVRHVAFSWAGWLLACVTVLHAFAAYRLASEPWGVGFLVFGTFACVVHAARSRLRDGMRHLLAEPASWMSVGATVAAIAFALAHLSFANAGRGSVEVGWAAALLLVMALIEDVLPLFIAGQILLAGAGVLAVISRLATHAWFNDAPMPLLHPWSLQIGAIVLAAMCLGWKLLRIITGRIPLLSPQNQRGLQAMSAEVVLPSDGSAVEKPVRSADLTPSGAQSPPRLFQFRRLLAAATPFDTVLSFILLGLLLVFSMRALLPGIANEFSSASVSLQDAAIGQWAGAAPGCFLRCCCLSLLRHVWSLRGAQSWWLCGSLCGLAVHCWPHALPTWVSVHRPSAGSALLIFSQGRSLSGSSAVRPCGIACQRLPNGIEILSFPRLRGPLSTRSASSRSFCLQSGRP